jgi:ABC-2 type transport system permease protein
MTSVFSKALWERRRSLLGWSSALAALILLESALWPSMQSMSGLDDYLAEFPEPLKEAFGIDQMSTGTGFLNAELFSLMLPLLFIAFAISHGAKLIAGEEENGGLDLLLVTPLTTARLLLESLLALVTALGVLAVVVLASTVAGSAVFGLEVAPGAAAAGALSVWLLGVEFGVVALVAGALTGRKGIATAAPAALALVAYVLFIGGAFVEQLASWRGFSPFDRALHAGPLAATVPGSLIWLAVVPAGCVLVALPLWGRRDI